MDTPTPLPIDREPAVAKWELWSIAQMLISTRSDGAEAHAQERLAEATAKGDEADEIVWTGVLSQLERIRSGP